MKLLLPSVLVIAGLLVTDPLCVSAQSATGGASSPAAASPSATPHRPDGQPDLNGVWTAHYDAERSGEQKPTVSPDGLVFSVVQAPSRLGGLYSGEQDGRIMSKGDRNKPMYKPEYWEKVKDNERHLQQRDAEYHCGAWGVPRIGEPQQIVQQDNMFIFLYSSPSFGNPYRVIPMNRPHDPDRVAQETSRGDSVGHWEGDTLVVDTTGFNDETWLAGHLGYIHSTSLHVIERFTRQGNKITYEVTVEDPEMLLQPWVLAPRTVTFNPNPTAMLPEDYPCAELDVNYTPIR